MKLVLVDVVREQEGRFTQKAYMWKVMLYLRPRAAIMDAVACTAPLGVLAQVVL